MKKSDIYQHLDELSQGHAPDTIVDGCLVLEGGAFRGLYTAGVLDVLMQEGINLQTTVGVSAGALNGMNYCSGDIGRSARFNLSYRHDERYVGREAFRRNNEVIGFDFLFSEEINEKMPFDLKRFSDPRREFYAVATDCESGLPTYFGKDSSNIFLAVKASSAMPFLSEMVMIDEKPYLDGGCSVKIPLDFAISSGKEKIVVVTTRDKSYRRKKNELPRLSQAVYHRYPAFVNAQLHTNRYYNETVERITDMEKKGKLFWIAPSEPVRISRLEGDMEKLGDLYWLGQKDAKTLLPALKEYLNIKEG
ncbi:MAG: patatin family protein [Erysipelotrichaceae bacterium]|nr:patatin family protein [Erysipelotrichaceae bacterium]